MNKPEPRSLGKSRDIPVTSYYTILQLEYIGYKVRQLLYKRDYDKKVFGDISNMKKEKIEGMSRKNCLPSIFNSEESKEKYIDKFFNEWGMPNFTYSNDYHKQVRGNLWDPYHYFIIGADVKVLFEGKIEFGCIKECDVKNQMLMVECDGKLLPASFDNVSRVFSDDFFKSLFE